jgi:hypothetical protein
MQKFSGINAGAQAKFRVPCRQTPLFIKSGDPQSAFAAETTGIDSWPVRRLCTSVLFFCYFYILLKGRILGSHRQT